jgi:hypothetical protein
MSESVLVELFPVARAAVVITSQAPDQRLRLQSRLLSGLFLILFLAAGVEIILALGAMLFRLGSLAGIQDGAFAFVLPLPPWHEAADSSFVPAAALPVWQSTLAAALLAARLLPGLVILWNLRSLFLLYSRGCVFARENAQQIRLIACALLVYAAVPFFTHGVLFLFHMATTPVKLQIRQVDALILGLVLFTIARVMMFGREIERDRDGFV